MVLSFVTSKTWKILFTDVFPINSKILYVFRSVRTRPFSAIGRKALPRIRQPVPKPLDRITKTIIQSVPWYNCGMKDRSHRSRATDLSTYQQAANNPKPQTGLILSRGIGQDGPESRSCPVPFNCSKSGSFLVPSRPIPMGQHRIP